MTGSKITVALALSLALCLMTVSVFAQNGLVSKQTRINRTYEELAAAFAVVSADGLETVYCKFSNEGSQAVVVVLTIVKASGGTDQRQVEVHAGSLASINIGDIASASVSITRLGPGENSQDEVIARRAVLRDQLTKRDGKLTAIELSGSASREDATPPKIDRSQQTTKIIEIIFGKNAMAGLSLTDEDHKIADHLLRELVKGSCQMSLAKVLFESVYNFDPDIKDIVLDLIKAYGKNCGDGAKKGEYYETIVVTIKAKYRTAFANRKQNGEWLMTIE